MMKEIPILFRTPMVQAILDGRKTMTRRTTGRDLEFINKNPNDWRFVDILVGNPKDKCENVFRFHNNGTNINACCPYGKPGDRLWVRERFAKDTSGKIHYYTDFNEDNGMWVGKVWKASIHMPKSACRIWLEVVSVRVGRLQEITEQNAIAEGVITNCLPKKDSLSDSMIYHEGDYPTDHFQSLWNKINGPESWNANPWVWVVEFKRIEKK